MGKFDGLFSVGATKVAEPTKKNVSRFSGIFQREAPSASVAFPSLVSRVQPETEEKPIDFTLPPRPAAKAPEVAPEVPTSLNQPPIGQPKSLFADLPFDFQPGKRVITTKKDADGRKINTFPEHLGGGVYYDTMADTPPTTPRGNYGGVSTEEGFERDHIVSLFLAGADTIENIKLRQSGNFIERFLDTPVQQIPHSRRQEGKLKKEMDIYNRYKDGKINRADAITELKRWEFEQEIKATQTQDLIKNITSDMFKLFKGGTKLFTEGIPQAINAEFKGIGIGKLIDALHAGTEVKDEDKFLDRSTIQQLNSIEVVKELPSAAFRSVKNVGIGLLGAISDIAGAAEWAGLKKGAPVSAKIDEWIEEIAPVNPSFAEQIQQGTGSLAAFYIPGVGAMKGVQFFSTFSPKIATFAGATIMGLFESAAEAGGVYKESKASGDSPEVSNDKADKTFMANIALNIITNKLGIFGDKTKNVILKALISSPLEGLQEGTQQIISNLANGKPIMEGVKDSAIIGAILGFFAGAGTTGRVTGGVNAVEADTKGLEEVIKQVEATQPIEPAPPGAPAVAPAGVKPKIDFSKTFEKQVTKPKEVIEESVEIFSVKEQKGELKKKAVSSIKESVEQSTVENIPLDRESLRFEGITSENFTDVVENFVEPNIAKLKALYETAEAKVNEVISIIEKLPGNIQAAVDVKRPTSVINKIIRKRDSGRKDYGIEDIGDFVRSSVIYDSIESVETATKDLVKQFPTGKVKVQDFFEVPTNMGFQGRNFDITLKDGSISELQFHTEESWKIKNKIHPFYEKARPFGQKIPKKIETASKKEAKVTVKKFGLAEKALNLTKQEGGATISIEGKQPKRGFSLALDKSTEKSISKEKINTSHVFDYIDEHFDEIKKPGNFLGLWEDDGSIVMDISTVFQNKVEAVKAAQASDQDAIYDLKENNEITKKDYEKIIGGVQAETKRDEGAVQAESGGRPAEAESVEGKQRVIEVTPRKVKAAEKKPVRRTLGTKKQSAAFQRVEENLKAETKNIPTYNQLNLAKDTANAIEFVEQQPDKALKIGLGLASPPPGITETAISIAAQELAVRNKDFGEASRLATSRSLRQTRRGQEIVAERGRFDENSPSTFIQLVLRERVRQAVKYEYSEREDKLTEKLKKNVTEKAKLQRKIVDKKAASVKSAQKILDSLIC